MNTNRKNTIFSSGWTKV